MSYASSALLAPDAREREAHLLAELMPLSRVTVLLAEAGSDKSVFLERCVMPLIEATPQGGSAGIAVLFDEWNEEPLPALLAKIREGVPGLDPQRAKESRPSVSLAATIARWQHALDATFLIVLDRFEEHLADRQRPGAAEFEDEFIRVMNTPELRAHFLIALEEDSAVLLKPLRAHVPSLGDAVIRLPRAVVHAAQQSSEDALSREGAGTLIGSPPPADRAVPPTDETPLTGVQGSTALVGSARTTAAPPEPDTVVETAGAGDAVAATAAFSTADAESEPLLRIPREPVAASLTPLPVQGPPRVPAAAWAVLGLLLAAAVGVLVLTVWEPAARPVETGAVSVAPAPSAEFADAPAADAGYAAQGGDAASASDDEMPLPVASRDVPVAHGATSAPPRFTSAQAAAVPRPIATLYVHVRDEAQRAWAEQLIQPLATRGVRVTGIKVVKVGPASADLRYFRPQEAADAGRIAGALREVGVPPPRLKRVTGFESPSTAWQYELWLAPGNPKAAGY